MGQKERILKVVKTIDTNIPWTCDACKHMNPAKADRRLVIHAKVTIGIVCSDKCASSVLKTHTAKKKETK